MIERTDDVMLRAGAVRLAVFDCDGVFTDGHLWMGDDGHEYKAFHVHDGHGIRRLLEAGVEVAVISGRRSKAVRQRMLELGVNRLFEGVNDKLAVLRTVQSELGVDDATTLAMGDDLPDLPMLRVVGFAVTPAGGAAALDEVVHLRTRNHGGAGAVREVCDLLIAAGAGG